MRMSTLERRQWRDKCRKLLAQHICERVGITIQPADVRLVTSKDEPYSWRAVPHMRHLFTKQLSDHTLGAFKDLCGGVGVTFEAVPRRERRSVTPSIANTAHFSAGSAQTTLSSRIDELLELNSELVKDVSNLRDRLASEAEARERLEGELDLVNRTNQMLREEIQKRAQECDYFRNASYKYSEGIRKLFPIVDHLRNTATFTEEGGL